MDSVLNLQKKYTWIQCWNALRGDVPCISAILQVNDLMVTHIISVNCFAFCLENVFDIN
jgi:hypothetical protein